MKVYEEQQRFNQWWLWLIVLGLLVFMAFAFLQQVLLGTPVGEQNMSNWTLAFFFIFFLAFTFTLSRLILRTEIDKEKIHFNYGPFGKHTYRWEEIRKVQVIDYGMVGYGFRKTRDHGTVYNVRGRQGLEITFKEDKKVTIGTQKPEQLRQFLVKIKRYH